MWTISELRLAAERALAVGYQAADSGRIRALPDARTIRYYGTLGLLDRPAEMRGRTAFYDRRHLLQLVAIKKLQAQGKSLAEVQEALAGASTKELEEIAGVLAAIDTQPAEASLAEEPRKRESLAEEPRKSARSANFWKARADSRGSDSESERTQRNMRTTPARVQGRATSNETSHAITRVHLSLQPGVELVFDAQRLPSSTEREMLSRAAAELINTLQQCGFATAKGETP